MGERATPKYTVSPLSAWISRLRDNRASECIRQTYSVVHALARVRLCTGEEEELSRIGRRRTETRVNHDDDPDVSRP